MSNQPPLPPAARTKAPPPASRGKPRDTARPAGAREQRRETLHAPADPDEQMDVDFDEAVVTAGHNGETNLSIEWVSVPLTGTWGSVYFRVTSLPDHGLEGQWEQLSYRKTYTGSGSFQTDVAPAAPVGTPGKLVVRDLATGEMLEQTWRWVRRGGGSGFFAWLVKTVKKLFTKPS